jgi:hypothetical protein
MLAVNITASMRGKLDARDGSDIRACAEKWWAISNTTLDGYADELMAVAGNEVAGMFTIKDWRRDPTAGDKVIFDLASAPEWQWLVGQPSPVTWTKAQANPVRKVPRVITESLNNGRPHHIDAGHGWSLDVEADGRSATVRAPGPAVAITSISNGTATIALI